MQSSKHDTADARSGGQDEEEGVHFQKVIATHQHYSKYATSANNRRRKDFLSLPREDRQLLENIGYSSRLDEVDAAILKNKHFIDQLVEHPEIFGVAGEEIGDLGGCDEADGHQHQHTESSHPHSHSHSHYAPALQSNNNSYKPLEADLDKLRSTLKQLVRDWSTEGEDERKASYGPMKDALLAHFVNVPEEERVEKRVLIPGAGLGRLAFDVASLGFACQGNEFSHYMLLASHFILNRTTHVEQQEIYPYVHSLSNALDKKSVLRSVKIPDVLPSSLPPDSDFSLVAGDFEEIYGAEYEVDSLEPQSGQWDAVMTCFFIDTAKNIINYLRIIHRILAPGGVWINLGPLLWHWENNQTNDLSVELDLQQVKALAREIGFDISNEREIPSTYTNNSHSMLRYTYNAAFWTATKRA
ncbi:N2227-domain-containing protein [Pterulicium gracile]|uniref:carnosine N-methyltransferase n=1 Tax=Pterulicium gracile TaxID=1884261 RepID=A0A5C3QZ89_9AGAR|nr:N2227-domain-containing protein [Pterula gracilis]